MLGLTVKEYMANKRAETLAKKVEYNGTTYFLGEISGNRAELYNLPTDEQVSAFVELDLITFI